MNSELTVFFFAASQPRSYEAEERIFHSTNFPSNSWSRECVKKGINWRVDWKNEHGNPNVSLLLWIMKLSKNRQDSDQNNGHPTQEISQDNKEHASSHLRFSFQVCWPNLLWRVFDCNKHNNVSNKNVNKRNKVESDKNTSSIFPSSHPFRRQLKWKTNRWFSIKSNPALLVVKVFQPKDWNNW